MPSSETLGEELERRGISRRTLLKFATAMATSLALPPSMSAAIAQGLAKTRRQSVIWLSFQECTGCLESLTRSESPDLETLIFYFISLDYQETLMAAAGTTAEDALFQAAADNKGDYLLVIDGSVPVADDGVYAMTGGRSDFDLLQKLSRDAKAILAIGTCAAYGGLPKAAPNPTGAVGIADVIGDKPIANIPGCPPIPEVLTGVLVNFLSFGRLPDLDEHGRPLAYFGTTIHDQCYRRPFYDQGKFAKSFDDDGARQGWCLFELGCKGPVTHNACASLKWGGGTSYPIQSGHGCLGCSEPDFWDKGGFYTSLSGGDAPPWRTAAGAGAAGLAIGAAAAWNARRVRSSVDRQVAQEWQEKKEGDA
ncbi:hydrogenase small subunit [Aquicoccus sp. SU-CL01552]